MHNVTELQRELIRRGYLPALNAAGEHSDDGKFGHLSLDAYNHFRASKGKGPVVQASMAELNADLFPEDYHQPRKVTPMNPVNVDVVSAWLSTKNWAAAFSIIATVLGLIGIHIPGDLGPAIQQFLVAGSALYVIIKNTWFTTTVTAASAKKL